MDHTGRLSASLGLAAAGALWASILSSGAQGDGTTSGTAPGLRILSAGDMELVRGDATPKGYCNLHAGSRYGCSDADTCNEATWDCKKTGDRCTMQFFHNYLKCDWDAQAPNYCENYYDAGNPCMHKTSDPVPWHGICYQELLGEVVIDECQSPVQNHPCGDIMLCIE